jgi:hypothetical protein
MKPKPVKFNFKEAQDEQIDNFLELLMEERFYVLFKLREKK